jgi:hypothetical protein
LGCVPIVIHPFFPLCHKNYQTNKQSQHFLKQKVFATSARERAAAFEQCEAPHALVTRAWYDTNRPIEYLDDDNHDDHDADHHRSIDRFVVFEL